MVDLEIGEAVKSPSMTVDLNNGDDVPRWVHRFRAEKPHRRRVWFNVAMLTGLISLLCYCSLYLRLKPYVNDAISMFFLLNLFPGAYVFLVYYLTIGREPVPYVLRRYEKQLVESTVVVVSSCWTYFERDGGNIWTAILGLTLLFKVLPLTNLWWDFENFGVWDCCLIILIDAALFCCRDRGGGGILLTVIAGVGVALQLIKNAYRHYCSQKIKNQTEKHLI